MTVFHYSLAAGQQALYLTMKEQFHHIHIDPTEIMIRIVVGVEELPASYRRYGTACGGGGTRYR